MSLSLTGKTASINVKTVFVASGAVITDAGCV